MNLNDSNLEAALAAVGAADTMPRFAELRAAWPAWVAELRGMTSDAAPEGFTPDEWAPAGMMADGVDPVVVAGNGLGFVAVGDGEVAVTAAGLTNAATAAVLAAGFRVCAYDPSDESGDVVFPDQLEETGALPRPAGRVERGTDEQAVILADTVAANAVLVTVRIHAFGIRRKAGASLDVSADGERIDESVLSIGKKLIDSKTYDEIASLDGRFRREVEKRALPSRFRRGTWLLPIRLLDWFEVEVEAYREERAVLVEQLCGEYAGLVEAAEAALGPLFNARQYPDVVMVRACYRVETQYESPGVPKALEAVAPEIFAREGRKLRNAMEEAAREARDALRRGLLAVVGNLQDKLTPEEGKKKRLSGAAVVNLNEWLELFDARNVTSDGDLSALVERCRGLMAGVDRDLLKDDETIREQVRGGFAAVTKSLGAMVEDGPVRRFTFDDE